METPDPRAGIPEPTAGRRERQKRSAADLCRTFMEQEGWLQVFDIARGNPYRALVKTGGFGRPKAAEVTITPDLDQRLAAYKLVTAYGYGRPAELADPDSGRTVTDLLLNALRPSGRDEKGAE